MTTLVKMQSERKARQAVGSCVKTAEGEWVSAKRVKFQQFRGALGADRVWFVEGSVVKEATARRRNAVHPRHLSRDLSKHGERTETEMPEDAVTLIPRNSHSHSASGERVALAGDTVLHERCGDPDNTGGWYHYTVRIEDPDLAARVRKFIAKQGA